MPEEPMSLGDRLAALERQASLAAGDIAEIKASAEYGAIMLDEVLMPAILVLAGQGHRDMLHRWLRSARQRAREADRLEDVHIADTEERILGWARAVDAIPAWQPLEYAQRHPDTDP